MKNMNWNEQWKKESENNYWKVPDPDVVDFFQNISISQYPDVLDYGCGIGRHSIFLAKKGFKVTAIDVSEKAITYLNNWCKAEDCKIETIITDLNDPLFNERSYDIILSNNVVYHNRRKDIMDRLERIWNILKPEGFFYFTIPTREDGKYGFGQKVEDHTYLCEKSVHPGDIHYFADEKDIRNLLKKYRIYSLKRDEHYWNNNGVEQFSSYWKIICKPEKENNKQLLTDRQNV
ncbi:MAG: class I SAM-dependent methyltransferase [Spirochaetales bacterium]|nr:class I SAM-dependent methyltransferase [Spirochaetales bacterium]